MVMVNSTGHEMDEQTSLDLALIWRIKDIASSYGCALNSFNLNEMSFDISGDREEECAKAILDKLTELQNRSGKSIKFVKGSSHSTRSLDVPLAGKSSTADSEK